MEDLIQALRINVAEKQELIDKFNEDLVELRKLAKEAIDMLYGYRMCVPREERIPIGLLIDKLVEELDK